jgi:hypothetical protein
LIANALGREPQVLAPPPGDFAAEKFGKLAELPAVSSSPLPRRKIYLPQPLDFLFQTAVVTDHP